MCGRFEIIPEKIKTDFLPFLEELTNEKIEFRNFTTVKGINTAPTDKILCFEKEENYFLSINRWGIKFKPDSPLIFNSRIETIKEKPYWKNLFARNKCLIPMTSFYEWKTEGKKKQPYRIFLKEHSFFFVPALFHLSGGEKFISLVTTTPNNFIRQIHHRMPVIFTKENALNFFLNDIETNLNNCNPLDDNIEMNIEAVVM